MAQCTGGLEALYAGLPLLKAEFPVISVACNDEDNLYPTSSWFTHGSRRMLQRYLQSDEWWAEQKKLCAYAHVPIGNLGQDYPAHVADVLFARTLKASNHLLWYSPSPAADLGGRVEDDSALFEDEHVNPEVITPGCYRDVCIEMDLGNLAINTVVKAKLIEELEGGMGMQSTDATDESTGVSNSAYECQDAFNALRNLVNIWLQDTARGSNLVADTMLQHFHRWLRSPSSMLYDPALHRMVHKMMKKVWMQLLQRFRKLGSTVVYASFTKLIIYTGKPTIERAMPYCKYVNDTIQQRPLFEWMDIEPTLIWETLMYLDSANYGGITYNGKRLPLT
jgi:DNA polymerase epsilon subunit 1